MNIARQSMSFVLVGCCLVVTDWVAFVLLTAAGMGAPPANVIGRATGALLGFWLNGWITFGQTGAPRFGYHRFARFTLLWLTLTLLSTVLITMLVVRLSLHVAWLAKPAVEAGMAVLSFFACRRWVYR